MKKAKKFNELVLARAEYQREFSILNIVITENNRELGRRFHSLQPNPQFACYPCSKCFVEVLASVLFSEH